MKTVLACALLGFCLYWSFEESTALPTRFENLENAIRVNEENEESSESRDTEEVEEEEEEDNDITKRNFIYSGEKHGSSLEKEEFDPDSNVGHLVESFRVEHDGHILKPKGLDIKQSKVAQGTNMDYHKLTKEQQIALGLESTDDVKKRNFLSSAPLWPNKIIPYVIVDNDFSQSQKDIINAGAAEISSKTCVKWEAKTDAHASQLGHTSYVSIFSESGCWSYVGKVFPNEQQLSLQAPGCVSLATTIHEMAHAMGMMHEQSRNDRDNYVIMNWNNIQGGTGNFNMAKSNTFDNHPYDAESVLQYGVYSFSSNGQKTIEFLDPRIEFLADSASGLEFYDVADITTAYSCADHCSNPPVCENGGFVDYQCNCYCPEGTTGTLCELPDTDQACGGIIDISSGPLTITTPNYPQPYNTGVTCTWLVKTSPGFLVKATIDNFQLSRDTSNNVCYHWLEVRYNLPGQTGPRLCGDINGEEYMSTPDGEANLMILIFDSKYASDRAASNGFSITVENSGAGCVSNPCIFGSCTSPPSGGYTCTCDQGVSGINCDQVGAEASFECGFEGAYCILQNADDDQFDWESHTGGTPSSGTGPSSAHAGNNYVFAETSSPRVQGDVARLKTSINLPAAARCLSLWYHMYGGSVGSLEIFYSGSSFSKLSLWSRTGDQGDTWFELSVDVPPVEGLEIIVEAVRGSSWNSDVAIDDVVLRPGSCTPTTPAPTTPSPTTPAPTTPAPTTPAPTTAPPASVETCDFEDSTTCFLVESTMDTTDWAIREGNTPSSNTGPSNAAQGSKYAYFETSNPRQAGDNVVLISDVTFADMDYCLSFQYHMYGSTMGDLHVYRTTSQGNSSLWTLSGDQGDMWRSIFVDVPASDSLGVMFEAVRGSGYRGDVAIDDVIMTPGACSVCQTAPCKNGGTCTEDVNGFNCQCTSDFTGQNCTEIVSGVSCNFEDGAACMFEQSSDDVFDWTVRTGGTTSSSTGPSGAQEGTYYAYIETSSPRTNGDNAILKLSGTIPESPFCMTFWFHMYGSNIATLNILVEDDVISEYAAWTMSGDQGDQWMQAAVDIPSGTNTKVAIEGIRGSSYRGDIAIDDIRMDIGACGPCQSQPCTNGGTCVPDVSSYTCTCPIGYTGVDCETNELSNGLYECSFEDLETACFLDNIQNVDDFDWTMRSGSTPSSNTGPSAAADGSNYAYVEVSRPRANLDVAYLTSEDYTFPPDDRCLTFQYHMYGSDSMGTLTVEAGDRGNEVDVWSLTGNQGNQWLTAKVNIPAESDLVIYFSANRGSSWKGDIAIDDVQLLTGNCP